jgi:hypothetical protein
MSISKRLLVLCGLVLSFSIGCGGGSAMRTAAMPAGGGSPGAYEASASGAKSSAVNESIAEPGAPPEASVAPASVAPPPPPSSAPSTSAPSGTTAQRESPAPQTPPRERPGLGTEWGESRASHVHDVAFVRQDEDRPFAMAALHYNDRPGIEALASYHASHGPRFRDVTAAGGAITVAIHDGAGEALEAVHVVDRTYVIGRAGERYTIVITNHTDHRFEALATVDGLDVINGRAGSLANRGYVLMPYATLEIDGFRQSQDAVAAFRFAKVADSYAAQTGSARNVGVIGVAFFTERGDSFLSAYSQDELRTRDTASPFPGQDPRYAKPPRR